MTTLRELTVDEVTGILSRGTFTELISTVEHVQLECKNGFYDTTKANNKIELAKDISALANSRGGYLLIGPATEKNPLHQGDEVISVSEFASSAFHPDIYRDILRAFIYPPISDLKIQWHPSSVGPRRCSFRSSLSSRSRQNAATLCPLCSCSETRSRHFAQACSLR
jgi:Putative DNA-binding domain